MEKREHPANRNFPPQQSKLHRLAPPLLVRASRS